MKLSETKAGMYFDADRPPTDRVYTAVFGPDGEEIDVHALTRLGARRIALAAAARDYEPGMRLRQVVGPRVGLFT